MIAKYPPMGWNSWDCYGAAVNEAQVKQNAEFIAKNLAEFGWEYVVVDIQWYQPSAINHSYVPFAPLCMDGFGRLIPAENRFPSGFKALADYIHSLGLKFGIHIMRGLPRQAAVAGCPIKNSGYTCAEVANPNSICAWNPDMYGTRQEHPGAAEYYRSIFELYAEWGVDYVKCDDIAREYPHCEREIELISEACRSCGRDMVLSLSPGPAPLERAGHLSKYANMWRITDDFWDDWKLLKGMFERAEKWAAHAGPGHWPDADMLPLGAVRVCNGKNEYSRFTPEEVRTMMTLWCMMRSPLMIGAELTLTDEESLAFLKNTSVLDIEKQSYCAHQLMRNDDECVWIAPRKDGMGAYVAAFNLSDEEREIAVDRDSVEIEFMCDVELWTGKDNTQLKATLKPHDAAVWMIS